MTTTVPEETNETNDMPRPDVSKLPTIPTELPKVVLDYAETSSRGRVQIKHAKKFLADLNEYGPVILSQHHAEGAAELLLEESPEYEAQRAAISNAEADAQKYYEAYQKLQEDADNARAAIIAEIVAKSQGDTDFEEADIEYSIALTALSSNVKNFQAAGDSVYNALKDFVKNIPTSKDLVEGKRKGTRSSSTMPGSNSSDSGWKPSFEWLEVKKPGEQDFSRVENVTSIGQLAKALDGGKSYESILNNLKASVNGVASLKDDEVYTWTRTVQNLDEPGTESVITYRGKALSRATKNARAQERAAAEKAANLSVATPDTNNGDSAGEDAAVNF